MHFRFLLRLLLLFALFNATLVSAWHVHHHEGAECNRSEPASSAAALEELCHAESDQAEEAACLACVVQAQMGAFVLDAHGKKLSVAPVEAVPPCDATQPVDKRQTALRRFAARAPPEPVSA